METRSNHVLVGAVVLAMLAGLLLFTVWLAGLSNKTAHCFDIYFAQAVGGLNKGATVSFSGVPVGTIEKISLLPDRPEFVWVRINVDDQTPVLQGTTAADQGRRLHRGQRDPADGAVKGGRPMSQPGPQGCPVIPSSSGGLGALLNSAPELIDRIQRLTERLTELLSDENQNSIADILENVEADHRRPRRARARPGRRDRRRAHRGAQRRHRRAAGRNPCRQHQPAGQRAGQARRRGPAQVRSPRSSARPTTSTRWSPTRGPGVQNLTKSTLPEANRLVRDMRELTRPCAASPSGSSRRASAARSDREKLPDYKPRKRR